jgi:superfamily II DNA or RNA helicase
LGEWQGADPATGFQLVKTPDARVLKVADLVDDDPAKRDRVSTALKDPAQKNNRDHVDIVIALGLAKEGFDWIWCEHALTVGYRSSLTEIVQIIGRATRDAPGKTRARFTNLIAEPDASAEHPPHRDQPFRVLPELLCRRLNRRLSVGRYNGPEEFSRCRACEKAPLTDRQR